MHLCDMKMLMIPSTPVAQHQFVYNFNHRCEPAKRRTLDYRTQQGSKTVRVNYQQLICFLSSIPFSSSLLPAELAAALHANEKISHPPVSHLVLSQREPRLIIRCLSPESSAPLVSCSCGIFALASTLRSKQLDSGVQLAFGLAKDVLSSSSCL